MLLNNWVVARSVKEYLDYMDARDAGFGLCLQIPNNVGEIISLHESIQKELSLAPFAVLITAGYLQPEKDRENLLDAFTSIFFQPSYYNVNLRPVLFVEASVSNQQEFVDELEKKCHKQGLKNFIKYRIQTALDVNYEHFPFCYLTPQGNVDFDLLLHNWTQEYLKSDKAEEIHILLADGSNRDIIDTLINNETTFKITDSFRIANQFYEKEYLIKQYEHELHLKSIAEKHNRMYLSIQKTGRADALDWYYHEYEVLPTWYKQFGHIIKVIIGKRSFISLFRDDVKKNKD